jgi:hypothetical protein
MVGSICADSILETVDAETPAMDAKDRMDRPARKRASWRRVELSGMDVSIYATHLLVSRLELEAEGFEQAGPDSGGSEADPPESGGNGVGRFGGHGVWRG